MDMHYAAIYVRMVTMDEQLSVDGNFGWAADCGWWLWMRSYLWMVTMDVQLSVDVNYGWEGVCGSWLWMSRRLWKITVLWMNWCLYVTMNEQLLRKLTMDEQLSVVGDQKFYHFKVGRDVWLSLKNDYEGWVAFCGRWPMTVSEGVTTSSCAPGGTRRIPILLLCPVVFVSRC